MNVVLLVNKGSILGLASWYFCPELLVPNCPLQLALFFGVRDASHDDDEGADDDDENNEELWMVNLQCVAFAHTVHCDSVGGM